MTKSKLNRLAFGLMGLGLSLGLQAKDYFISPQGSDSNPGTLAKPCASLEQARDSIRSLSLQEKQEDINVYLRGGHYKLSKTFVLNTQDSALDGFKTTYAAYKNASQLRQDCGDRGGASQWADSLEVGLA